MYTNVINTAFEGMTRITDAVAMLEIFYTLARRDAIKQTCLKKTAYTYMLFVRYTYCTLCLLRETTSVTFLLAKSTDNR